MLQKKEDVAQGQMGVIKLGAISDKPSGGIRNACLSSERRQAWRMCILFP